MAERNIQPIGERVLVEPIEAQTVTAGGIILPDSAKEKPQQSKVLAIGAAIKDSPVKVGDRVIHGKFAGVEIEQDGKKYLILQLSDILASF